MEIKIDTRLQWAFRRTSQGVMGVCEAIGLTLEAEDEAELRCMAEESVHYLLLDLLEDGQLQQFLLDRGWTPMTALPTGYDPRMPVRFSVPIELIAQSANAT